MYDFRSRVCIVLTCDKEVYNKRRNANAAVYSKLYAAGFDIVFLFAKDPIDKLEIHIIQDSETSYYTMTVPCEDNYDSLTIKMSYAYTFFNDCNIDGVLKIDDDVGDINDKVLDPFYYSADYLGAKSSLLSEQYYLGRELFPPEGDFEHEVFFHGPFYWLSKKALSHLVTKGINYMFGFAEDVAVGVALCDTNLRRFDPHWFYRGLVRWPRFDFINYLGGPNTELCEIMIRHGSDKAYNPDKRSHNYTTLYYSLFNNTRYRNLRIFEMGIGTTNLDILSNMGADGTPGASHRGWAEFFPNSMVYGADIDKDILFQTDRIHTYWCDQTNPAAIAEMWKEPELQEEFDIIVDDGLHRYEAGKCFFENSVHKLKVGGFYIIEDVSEFAVDKYERCISVWSEKFLCCKFTVTKVKSLDNNILLPGDNNLVIIEKLNKSHPV
jgi:hypothetical protein